MVEIEDAVIDRKAIDPEKGLTAEITISIVEKVEEEETIIIEVTDPIIDLGVDQGIAMEIEEIIDLRIGKVIEETHSGSTMVTKDIEIEV